MDGDSTHLSVMQQALGAAWDQLGGAVRRHYGIAPGTRDERVMHGVMHEISHAPLATPLILAGRLFGALVARNGRDIPVVVRNWTTTDSPAVYWHRTFTFADGPPLLFSSRMEYAGGDEIIEFVRAGLGIRMRLSVVDGALRYESRGYDWRIGPVRLHLPDWLLLGHAVITETATSDNGFSMAFRVDHPLWGRTFSYSGAFTLGESDAAGG